MNSAWAEKLKPTHKLVLMALADNSDDDCYCWPSVPTLARKTGMDERSVQRILRVLESLGLLKVEPRFRNDGSATTNGYHLILGGDKLSPPLRQNKHQVVAVQSPPSGTGVTQTTTEPTINLKQPPQPSNEILKATSGGGKYIFPKQLKQQECELAKAQLDTIDPALAQAVLDELAARLNANKVTGAPLSYLRSLINRAKSGQFTPEAGVRIASSREQAKVLQIKNQTNSIKPSDPKKIPSFLKTMHEAVGRKPQQIEQE